MTSSDNLNLGSNPDRYQPSFFKFPINNDRAGYQPWAMPVVLVVPYRYDQETGLEFIDSLPSNVRYYIADVPNQALVAGYDHKGILVPEEERYVQALTISELINQRIDLGGVDYFRRQPDGSFVQIDQTDAIEGDYIEYTLLNGTRGKVIFYPQTDYFDLSDISIETADLPRNRYRFIWEATYKRRNTQEGDFVCISGDDEPTISEMMVACPGEIHHQMVQNTPSVYFDGQDIENQSIVKAYRPFADTLQDIFDEQTLLRKINWIDEIPAQLIPYLSYLIGIDLPNFPGVSDAVRKSMTKNGYKLQKLKGTKRVIRELFEIFGFTVDVINVWYRSNGSGFVAPGEQLPDDEQEDEILLENKCQYDVLINDFSDSGFGTIEVPLLYRPNSGNVTLHAYLVSTDSNTYTELLNITSDLSSDLNALNSDVCGTDTEGFYLPSSISSRLPVENINGFGQVLIDTNLGSTQSYTAGSSTISKEGTQYNEDTSVLTIDFDGYQDFKSTDGKDLKLFVFAQYEREEITIPSQLTNLRSNRFDLDITFKSGEIISSNLFDFLINFVIKFKAFHSLIRKISFNTEFCEVYQVTDWCVGGIHRQKAGTDAGEQQVPPAIIPIDPSSCETLVDRGFKDSDLNYRRKVLEALEDEFDAWKSISNDVPDAQKALIESLSRTTIKDSTTNCGDVEFGQNRVESEDGDFDHEDDDRDVICDLNDNTSDYCYKGRVEDLLIDEKYVSLIEYVKCNPCHLSFGDGTYYMLPNGTKFDKLDLMITSTLHKMLKDWKVNGAAYQLYYSNRRGINKLMDAFLSPAITDRRSLNIMLPFSHFPGHRFPIWGFIESDFTHPEYYAKPWDDAYSSLYSPCKGFNQIEENPLNAEIVPATGENEELVFDTVPLTYLGNGLINDISSYGTHDSRDYQVTHSIYSTADVGPTNGSGDQIVQLDGTVHTTADAIVQNKLFESWNDECNTDYVDGYPAEAGIFTFDPDEYGFNNYNDIDGEFVLGLPSTEFGSSGGTTVNALFRWGSGIICSNLVPPDIDDVAISGDNLSGNDVDAGVISPEEESQLVYGVSAGDNDVVAVASIASTNNASAFISSQLPSVISAGTSGSFTVSIQPGVGPFTVVVSVTIGGVAVYQFTISGTGATTAQLLIDSLTSAAGGNVPTGLWIPGEQTYSDNAETPAGDADGVYQLSDLTGNGNHFLQTTEANQPTLDVDGYNGVPCLVFDRGDGTDTSNWLSCVNDLSSVYAANSHSIAVLGNFDHAVRDSVNTYLNDAIVGNSHGLSFGSNRPYLTQRNNSFDPLYAVAGNSGGTASLDIEDYQGVDSVYGMIHNSVAGYYPFADKESGSPTGSGSTNLTNNLMLMRHTYATGGKIAAAATWNVTLTEEQHFAVVDVLRAYAGISPVADPV